MKNITEKEKIKLINHTLQKIREHEIEIQKLELILRCARNDDIWVPTKERK